MSKKATPQRHKIVTDDLQVLRLFGFRHFRHLDSIVACQLGHWFERGKQTYDTYIDFRCKQTDRKIIEFTEVHFLTVSESVYIYLFIYIPIYLSLFLCIYLSIYLLQWYCDFHCTRLSSSWSFVAGLKVGNDLTVPDLTYVASWQMNDIIAWNCVCCALNCFLFVYFLTE